MDTNRKRFSRTAEFMALFRALESRRPRGERLFEDAYAADFLRPLLRGVVVACRIGMLRRLTSEWIDRRWPGARTSGVARTLGIDEAVIAALGEGVAQIVILGAGFDSRAFRIPGIERARVFEVDERKTSVAKRTRLLRRLGSLPRHVSFVETDFARDDLVERLEAASFDTAARSCFVWEGVSHYLRKADVDVVLRSIARLSPPGSKLVFTYVDRRVLDTPEAFAGTERLMATLRRAGEPWSSGLDPRELRAFLREQHLELIEDRSAAEYRVRAFGAEAARMRGYEFYHLALARVCGKPGDERGPVPEAAA